jgi:hypothetical protein
MSNTKECRSTLHPSKIVIANITFLHLVFLCKYRHHILDFFVCLKYIGLDLDLRQWFFLRTPTNIGELQHMKYICDEIILITEYEKLHIYFKTTVVNGIFCWIFLWSLLLIYINWIKIHLEVFKFLVKNSLEICFFSHFFQQ